MLYISCLPMNTHPIHILSAQAQALNSLRKPCQTCEPPLWQTACDKKADIPDAYPPSLFRRTLPSFPQNLVLAKEALYAAKEGLQAGKEDV